jgi:hypothetical protein
MQLVEIIIFSCSPVNVGWNPEKKVASNGILKMPFFKNSFFFVQGRRAVTIRGEGAVTDWSSNSLSL